MLKKLTIKNAIKIILLCGLGIMNTFSIEREQHIGLFNNVFVNQNVILNQFNTLSTTIAQIQQDASIILSQDINLRIRIASINRIIDENIRDIQQIQAQDFINDDNLRYLFFCRFIFFQNQIIETESSIRRIILRDLQNQELSNVNNALMEFINNTNQLINVLNDINSSDLNLLEALNVMQNNKKLMVALKEQCQQLNDEINDYRFPQIRNPNSPIIEQYLHPTQNQKIQELNNNITTLENLFINY